MSYPLLPPEILGNIGKYSDVEVRNRMRRTGHAAFAVPPGLPPFDPAGNLLDKLTGVTISLLKNDNADTRFYFAKTVRKLVEQSVNVDYIVEKIVLKLYSNMALSEVPGQLEALTRGDVTLEPKKESTLKFIFKTIAPLCVKTGAQILHETLVNKLSDSAKLSSFKWFLAEKYVLPLDNPGQSGGGRFGSVTLKARSRRSRTQRKKKVSSKARRRRMT